MASNLADDLSRFLEGRPVQARPVGTAGRLWRLAKRKPAIASMAAALAVLIPAALAGMIALYLRADHDRRTAVRNLGMAQENFQLANDAVNKFLNTVTDNPKLNEQDFFELRKELLETALPFFQKFAQERGGDSESEAARGRAYHRLALVRDAMGEKETALADYDAMRTIFAKLAAEFPRVPSYRFDLAQSENNRGNLLGFLGRVDEAESALRAALRLKEGLADEFPDDPKFRWESARGHNNLGLLWKNLGRHDEAEAAFRTALKFQENLIPNFPGDPVRRNQLAGSHNNLGIVLKAQGKNEESETAHRAAQQFYGQLVAEFPKVAAHRNDLAMSLGNLANSLHKQDKNTEAEAAQRVSLALRQQLVADFPSVPEYRQDLGMSHYNLAHLLNSVGQIEEAETVYRTAVEIRERLAANFPTAPIYGLELGQTCINLGMLLEKKGDAHASLEWFSKAIVAVEPLVKMDARFGKARKSLAQAHKLRADGLETLDRHDEAVKDWERAIELADSFSKTRYQHRRKLWQEHYERPR